jgi:O-antigen ligase
VQRLRGDGGLWLLCAFALLSLMSFVWARDPADAVRDALKWSWYAGAFALTAACVERRDDAKKIAIAMVGAAVVVCAVGFWQATTVAPSSFSDHGAVIGRITGTLEGPNQLGAYLETVIPALAAMLVFGSVSWTTLIVGGLLLGALGAELLLAYSRGALWSCAAALLFLIAVSVWQRRADFTCPARRAAIAAALAALVIVPVSYSGISGIGWQHEFWSAGWGDRSDSAQRRVALWTCAATLAKAHPLVGVGAGNFADAMPECGHDAAALERSNANNWYLETAADLGLLGIVLLAAFMVTEFAAIRRAGALTDPIALGAYAVLIAFALHGLVDDVMPYPKAALSFFVLLATMPPVNQGQPEGPG